MEVILFDGECHLCDQSVQFTLRETKRLYITSLLSRAMQVKRFLRKHRGIVAKNRYKWFGKADFAASCNVKSIESVKYSIVLFQRDT